MSALHHHRKPRWDSVRAAKLRSTLTSRGPGGSRFQMVWFWRQWGFFMRSAWPRPALPIYRYVVRIGPLEIRRWGP